MKNKGQLIAKIESIKAECVPAETLNFIDEFIALVSAADERDIDNIITCVWCKAEAEAEMRLAETFLIGDDVPDHIRYNACIANDIKHWWRSEK